MCYIILYYIICFVVDDKTLNKQQQQAFYSVAFSTFPSSEL